eukprot:GCRY01003875.1.p1 GENE.GCRY01003875.1~~GCRY01003875.1.p1  ORF type:complete len:360 (+),score=17.80 GCRY01003875.1:147-1226(+)
MVSFLTMDLLKTHLKKQPSIEFDLNCIQEGVGRENIKTNKRFLTQSVINSFDDLQFSHHVKRQRTAHSTQSLSLNSSQSPSLTPNPAKQRRRLRRSTGCSVSHSPSHQNSNCCQISLSAPVSPIFDAENLNSSSYIGKPLPDPSLFSSKSRNDLPLSFDGLSSFANISSSSFYEENSNFLEDSFGNGGRSRPFARPSSPPFSTTSPSRIVASTITLPLTPPLPQSSPPSFQIQETVFSEMPVPTDVKPATCMKVTARRFNAALSLDDPSDELFPQHRASMPSPILTSGQKNSSSSANDCTRIQSLADDGSFGLSQTVQPVPSVPIAKLYGFEAPSSAVLYYESCHLGPDVHIQPSTPEG